RSPALLRGAARRSHRAHVALSGSRADHRRDRAPRLRRGRQGPDEEAQQEVEHGLVEVGGVMPGIHDLVVTPRLTIPGGELALAFARSGGPGGQNVNKVSSKVELRWNPTTSAALTYDD